MNMRRILGFCAVLAVVHLTLLVEMASAYQTPGAGRAASTPSAASPAVNAANNVLQGTTAPAPGAVGNATQTPAVPGAATNVMPGATTGTAGAPVGASALATQPGMTTNVMPGATTGTAGGAYVPATQPGTTTMAPGTVAPGSVYTQAVPSRGYSSYYVPGAQPAQTPVRPMADIPYYNSFYGGGRVQPGTGTSGYYTYPAGTYGGYSSMYVAPGSGYGYGTAAPIYRPARRGLFGGLFGRRNRQVYATSPYGYTYGAAPSGTTYGAAPYTSGYVTTPGTYTYGTAPY